MNIIPLQPNSKSVLIQLMSLERTNSKVSVGFFQKDLSFFILWLTSGYTQFIKFVLITV